MDSISVYSMKRYFECNISDIPDMEDILYKLYRLKFIYHYKHEDGSYCFKLEDSPYTLKVVNTPDCIDPINIEILCRNPNTIEDIIIYTINCNSCDNITKFVTSLVYVYTHMFSSGEPNSTEKIVYNCSNVLINDNISPEDIINDSTIVEERRNGISDEVLDNLKEFTHVKTAIRDIASGNYNLNYKRS